MTLWGLQSHHEKSRDWVDDHRPETGKCPPSAGSLSLGAGTCLYYICNLQAPRREPSTAAKKTMRRQEAVALKCCRAQPGRRGSGGQYQTLLIINQVTLLPEICFCRLHRCRVTPLTRMAACLVARPCTRLRQRLNDAGLSSRCMRAMTIDSEMPN